MMVVVVVVAVAAGAASISLTYNECITTSNIATAADAVMHISELTVVLAGSNRTDSRLMSPDCVASFHPFLFLSGAYPQTRLHQCTSEGRLCGGTSR